MMNVIISNPWHRRVGLNEDSVALTMCEKSIYRIRNLKKNKKKNKEELELSADIFLKDTSC